MSISKNNKNISFDHTWGGPLQVCGKGMISAKDLEVDHDGGKGRHWIDDYRGVEFSKGITEVGPGFLEAFPQLDSIVIHYTVKSIAVSPELAATLRKRKVLVRGWYDSYGERFAREHGLEFRHADIVVGWAYDNEHDTRTRLEIRFNGQGKPYRFYDDICTGWAASNNGGGTYERELDENFYEGETLETFAQWFTRFRDDILRNEDLAYYFKTAQKR